MSGGLDTDTMLRALLAASPTADLRERVLAAYKLGRDEANAGRRLTPEECGVEIPKAPVAGVPAPRVPDRFRGASFDNFWCENRSQEIAWEAAKQFVLESAANRPVMLALIGSQGVGKSHLLYAAANSLYQTYEKRVECRPWYLLADELRYGIPANPPYREEQPGPDVRAELLRCKILMIDEARPTSATEFDATELTKIACSAYDSGMSLLITTNITPLATLMGPFAASRFEQVVVTGPDRRKL